MTISPFASLACPLDGGVLYRDGAVWRCEAGHSFDIARQGYTHLLPVQKKKSLAPGDSKQMVAARQRFLAAGYYQPIAEAVSRTIVSELAANTTLSCLDAGCGEGYYLRQLAAATTETQTLALLGLDISKWAVLAAAKQNQHAAWVVGSNANLPIQSASLDRILCLFGFPVYAEFARVLKPGGELVQVDAGPDHLRELREIIYSSVTVARAPTEEAPEGFRVLSTETIRYPLALDHPEQIADLLAMTPHLYRAKAEGREKAAALDALVVTVDVRLKRLALAL
ncbi:putative RNA methyltransferase [Marinobacter caseinilyticus]|uniref:putative RNA methyltransferase n=1 Tax=Marinobacter caseinilyticus TaxID=2692195 RepID=UPI00140C8EDE|nr:methyltransferase domain-containing protein [Marinobacter caseinilyticus]